MSRFLLVTLPFVAHVNPMVPLARELTRRGHEVAWVTYPAVKHQLPPEDKAYFVEEHEVLDRALGLAREANLGLAHAYKSFVEDVVIPFSRTMIGPVDAAIDDFKPDAALVDLHTMAGALASRKSGLPWASSSPSGELYTDVFEEMEKVRAWRQHLFDDLQTAYGLEPVEAPDRSPYLILLYSTPAFVGEADYPPNYRFIGASFSDRVDEPDFPWEQLASGKKILVSLGSLFATRGERFFQVLQDALRDLDLQVIVSAPAEAFEDPPVNFLVRQWVPQLKLLEKVDAVITHGGSTVNEALAFGRPMVVAPITADQFVLATKVVDSGAGVRVRFRRVSPAELRAAVTTVLEEPTYGETARRIQDSFIAAGGSKAGADALERLLEMAR
jgi:MGT family glycosyltransferase